MDFKGIVNTLQITLERTTAAQAELRSLWLDKYGQIFVDLVLGDLQENIKTMTGTTDEAANQQMRNVQSRQLNHDHITAATGRDAAQQQANQQLRGEIEALTSEARSTFGQADEICRESSDVCVAISSLRGEIHRVENENPGRYVDTGTSGEYIG